MVRLYRPSDRAAIRQICCDTADKGESVERFFRDREVFADLLTRYYTDCAPEGTWVVEYQGRVAGYLTGCFDTQGYWRVMVCKVIPAAAMRALLRGVFFYRQTWRILWSGVRTFMIGGFRERASLRSYPAHLHLNKSAFAWMGQIYVRGEEVSPSDPRGSGAL